MPFASEMQRRKFYAMAERGEISPATVKRWEQETPKGEKLPKRVKQAFLEGMADAFEHFGHKMAAQECRLKIPQPSQGAFHGLDGAFQAETDKNTGIDQVAPETPQAPVERLTAMLQDLPEPQLPAGDARRDPLDRETMWGGPSNLTGGDAGNRISDLGQPTAVGTVF
jgi:hypothetical protein